VREALTPGILSKIPGGDDVQSPPPILGGPRDITRSELDAMQLSPQDLEDTENDLRERGHRIVEGQ